MGAGEQAKSGFGFQNFIQGIVADAGLRYFAVKREMIAPEGIGDGEPVHQLGAAVISAKAVLIDTPQQKRKQQCGPQPEGKAPRGRLERVQHQNERQKPQKTAGKHQAAAGYSPAKVFISGKIAFCLHTEQGSFLLAGIGGGKGQIHKTPRNHWEKWIPEPIITHLQSAECRDKEKILWKKDRKTRWNHRQMCKSTKMSK